MSTNKFIGADDRKLYKMWWYAVAYGAGPERRMTMIDQVRKANEINRAR